MKYYIAGLVVVLVNIILIATHSSDQMSCLEITDDDNDGEIPPNVSETYSATTLPPSTSTLNLNCTNEECMEIVSKLKSHIDQSYDPCDNFYKYSCGGWIKNQNHTTKRVTNDTHIIYEMDAYNQKILQDILESLNPELDSEKKLLDFYKSCLSFNGTITLKEENETPGFYFEGIDDTSVKKHNCTMKSKELFPDITGRLFVQRIYPPEKEEAISKLIEIVRQSYLKMISQISWMHNHSKFILKDKFRNLKVIYGYPKEILKTDLEVGHYENINITSDDYLHNIDELPKLKRNDSTFSHSQYVLETNAYYFLTDDTVMIPAGYSQIPHFHALYPPVINYAKMAPIVAHEMTHAFYTYALGNNPSLICPSISLESQTNFRSRSNCINKQYGDFGLNDVKLEGYRTLEENFADIAGLQVSLQSFLDNFGDSFNPLPGLEELSKEQIFFIAFAQTECRSFRDEETENSVLQTELKDSDDLHSPNWIRVLGQMINSKEFGQAFNCPIGSPLNNPEIKCHIFD